ARRGRAGAGLRRPSQRLLDARRDHRDVLRDPRVELVAAGWLRRVVLAEPHGVRVHRRLHLRNVDAVAPRSDSVRPAGRRYRVLRRGGAHGWVGLRLSGPYLAIFKLGFSEIVRITAGAQGDVTAGLRRLHTE